MRLLLTTTASVFLLATGGLPGRAQEKAPPAQTKGQNKAAQSKQQAKQKWIGPKLTPREQLELLMQMPPEDREQFLSQLPAAQRKKLEDLQKLDPEKRAVQLRRLDILDSLTPERKQAVTQEISSLNPMTFVQRRARMHSREFEQGYTPDELELIRDTFPGAAK